MGKVLAPEEVFDRMVDVRRTIHRRPELAFEEVETAQTLIRHLEQLGIPYEYQGKGGAVIGRLGESSKQTPTVALRAEMDALPGEEQTGVEFASEVEGRMHTCGHDAHAAMVVGAAELLHRDPPDGEVLFVFQPAEEKGGGAKTVVESGAVDDVDSIFAVHVTRQYPVGDLMIRDGVMTSQSDYFHIEITGRGGHGARPHEGIDAVVIASSMIHAVQTLVSRETNPLHPSVITVGRVEGGSAPNVIAGNAVLEGSIRSTLPEVRDHLHAGLRRMAAALAELHSARIDVEIEQGYPPVINSEREAQIARRAAAKVVGRDKVRRARNPSMGSEDFAFFLQNFPGCYSRLGARGEGEDFIPLHSPVFQIDEEAMRVGAAYFEQVVRDAIEEYSP